MGPELGVGINDLAMPLLLATGQPRLTFIAEREPTKTFESLVRRKLFARIAIGRPAVYQVPTEIRRDLAGHLAHEQRVIARVLVAFAEADTMRSERAAQAGAELRRDRSTLLTSGDDTRGALRRACSHGSGQC